MGATVTYVKADIAEVAAALAALTGEPHPLAPAEAALDATLTTQSPPEAVPNRGAVHDDAEPSR